MGEVKLLYLSFFLFVSCLEKPSEIHIAMFDTNFCQEKFQNIELVVANHSGDCPSHGSKILKRIDKKIKRKVKVFAFSIFDKGEQKLSLWEENIKKVQTLKVDYFLIAIGLPSERDLSKVFAPLKKKKTFVAAGQVGRGIEISQKLWPQEMYGHENIVLVGGYIEIRKGKKLYPKLQMYQSAIEEFHKIDEGEEIRGSSQAVANALIERLNGNIK